MQRLTVGDEVVVLSGNDKGKRGKITRVLKEKSKVIIEGVNQVKRHLKATPQRGGGILEVEAPIASSKVALIDPTSGKPSRIRYQQKGDNKIRVTKSGAELLEQRRK